MSSAIDYVGRLSDVLAYTGQTLTQETLLTPSLFSSSSSGEICTGIQKLAQRWLLEFLTISGSMPYLLTRGCPFIGYVRRGELRTATDVQQAFLLSEATIRKNLELEQTLTTPTDEQIDHADLMATSIAGDTLTLNITVYSKAGSTRKVIMPLPVRVG